MRTGFESLVPEAVCTPEPLPALLLEEVNAAAFALLEEVLLSFKVVLLAAGLLAVG
jgi:hypothetical protein